MYTCFYRMCLHQAGGWLIIISIALYDDLNNAVMITGL